MRSWNPDRGGFREKNTSNKLTACLSFRLYAIRGRVPYFFSKGHGTSQGPFLLSLVSKVGRMISKSFASVISLYVGPSFLLKSAPRKLPEISSGKIRIQTIGYPHKSYPILG